MRSLARATLCLMLLWASVAMALRWREVAARPISIPEGPVTLWRMGGVHEQQWSEFLVQVAQRVPEGSKVVVEAPNVDPSDEFFLFLWCAYHLPRHNVVRRHNLEPSEAVTYLLRPNGKASLLAIDEAPAQSDSMSGGGTGRVLLSGVGQLFLIEQVMPSQESQDQDRADA